MNILSIDTTTKTASIAISYNGETIQRSVTNEITHSEKLLPLIHNSLKEMNASIDDISLLACINGPGSFTGIRIGLATLKAFAQVKNINIFSMNSLEAIAYSTFIHTDNSEKTVVSLIDSRNNRVYYMINKLKVIDEKIVIENILNISNDDIDTALTDILSYLNIPSNIYFSGDCIDKYSDNILNATHISCDKLLTLYPTPQDIVHSIYNMQDIESHMFNAYTLDAIYARPSQAERVKHGEN